MLLGVCDRCSPALASEVAQLAAALSSFEDAQARLRQMGVEMSIRRITTNTWHPLERSRHQSVLGNLRLIDKWKPKRTYLIHYSGYEDQEHADDPINGPMSLDRLREELRRVAEGRDIRPACHGMVLGDRRGC